MQAIPNQPAPHQPGAEPATGAPARADTVLARALARIETRGFAWRSLVALAFVILLMRMIGAFPLPNDTQVVRISLIDSAGNAARIGAYAPAQPPALPGPAANQAIDPDSARLSNAMIAIQPSAEIAPPFNANGMAPDAQARAADCLAAAEWYEAGDNAPGERAVAQVVLNRARHPAFARSVCGAVFQGASQAPAGSGACQFTFACDGSIGARTPGIVAWTRARAIALAALAGAVDADVGLATHYHADYVVPRWRSSLVKLAIVGPHLFYRWPGYWGSPAALRPMPWGNDEPHIDALAHLSPPHAAAMRADATVLPPGGAAPASPAEAPNPSTPIPSTMAAARSVGDVAGVAPRPHANAGTERIDLMIDPGAFSGSYAVRAFGLCKDHPRCLVIGRNPAMPDAIAFLLLHDARKGVETALWNCARTVRPDTAQCLPDQASAVRMVANWLAS